MKFKKIYIYLLLQFFFILKIYASEVKFEASKIDIVENGNLILAYNSKTKIPTDKVTIDSNRAEYNKEKDIVKFIDDVYFYDSENNTIIEGDEIIYNRKTNLIYSIGKTKINLDNKYEVNSENIYFERIQKKIYGNNKAQIKDLDNNIYNLEDRYNFDLNKNIIYSKKSNIVDNNKNIYYFEDLVINLTNNEIAGKEVKIEFEDSYFGNKKNDPLLKGRSAHSSEENLKIYKAIFSTCNTAKKNCRGWELNSEEFNHDKKKKIFEYKNSWLKVFDYKIF